MKVISQAKLSNKGLSMEAAGIFLPPIFEKI